MPKKLETTDYTVKVARRIGGKMRQVGDTVSLTAGTAAHLEAAGAIGLKGAQSPAAAAPAAAASAVPPTTPAKS